MKKSILSVTSLCILIAIGSLMFYACQEENLRDVKLSTEGSRDALETVFTDAKSNCGTYEEQDYDDVLLDDSGDANSDGEVGDANAELQLYCNYDIVKIVKSDDPENTLSVGQTLCYKCPGTTTNFPPCPVAINEKRTILISYDKPDGTKCYYSTTVEVDMNGVGLCFLCLNSGKKLGNIGGLPGE